MGIAILGDYTSASVPATARAALVDHLAWESDHHGLDPLGVSTYTNPVSGAQKTIDTISGHRDWAATECPGGTLYAELPAIRRDVAAQLGAPPPDTQPPVISGVGVSGVTRTSAVVSWATNEPGTSQVAYWVSGTSTVLRTPLDVTLVTAHRVSLSGLRRRTRYAFRVTSADAAGNEATSSTSTFRTKR